MAFAPNLIKMKFKNLSVEELEEKYKELKKNYCFNSKEEQINHTIKNYLYASKKTNDNSTKKALEELLKEKTGKEYKIEPQKFEISLNDIITYIANPKDDLFWNKSLSNFFQKLEKIDEKEKINFLIELIQDKTSFNEFSKEIIKTPNIIETYNKYKKIAQDYIIKNSKKG